MKFKVTVIYQVYNGSVMTKEMSGVEKIEQTVESIGGSRTEVVRVYTSSYHFATWAAGAILSIIVIPERENK